MQIVIRDVKVNITATRSDEDPWRLSRIERLVENLSKRLYGNFILKNIYNVHDHKGTIKFLWDGFNPSKEIIESIQEYWYDTEGEITTIVHETI